MCKSYLKIILYLFLGIIISTSYCKSLSHHYFSSDLPYDHWETSALLLELEEDKAKYIFEYLNYTGSSIVASSTSQLHQWYLSECKSELNNFNFTLMQRYILFQHLKLDC